MATPPATVATPAASTSAAASSDDGPPAGDTRVGLRKAQFPENTTPNNTGGAANHCGERVCIAVTNLGAADSAEGKRCARCNASGREKLNTYKNTNIDCGK